MGKPTYQSRGKNLILNGIILAFIIPIALIFNADSPQLPVQFIKFSVIYGCLQIFAGAVLLCDPTVREIKNHNSMIMLSIHVIVGSLIGFFTLPRGILTGSVLGAFMYILLIAEETANIPTKKDVKKGILGCLIGAILGCLLGFLIGTFSLSSDTLYKASVTFVFYAKIVFTIIVGCFGGIVGFCLFAVNAFDTAIFGIFLLIIAVYLCLLAIVMLTFGIEWIIIFILGNAKFAYGMKIILIFLAMLALLISIGMLAIALYRQELENES